MGSTIRELDEAVNCKASSIVGGRRYCSQSQAFSQYWQKKTEIYPAKLRIIYERLQGLNRRQQPKIDSQRPFWSKNMQLSAIQRYVARKIAIDQANYSLRNRSNSSGETDNASANRQMFNRAIFRCPRSTPPK